MISVKFYGEEVFLKVWQIKVGRVNLYLMDSDIPKNRKEYRETTLNYMVETKKQELDKK